MGEAYDRAGAFLGDATGATKAEVLAKLEKAHGDAAHEIRIRSRRREKPVPTSRQMRRAQRREEHRRLLISRGWTLVDGRGWVPPPGYSLKRAGDDVKAVGRSRCPTCESPDPRRHPSMQPDGGEVQPCRDPWHAVAEVSR